MRNSAGSHLDLPRPGGFGLRQRQPQDPVVERGIDPVLVDEVGQAELAPERPGLVLLEQQLLSLPVVVRNPALDTEDVVAQIDDQPLGPDPGMSASTVIAASVSEMSTAGVNARPGRVDSAPASSCFFVVRDGTGLLQCVVLGKSVEPHVLETAKGLSVETAVRVRGVVKADERSPGGVELTAAEVTIVGTSGEYPITPKEHGTAFLMENRHLWVRSSKQHAILRIRHQVEIGIQEYLHGEGFVRYDTPILTPCAAEGTSNLFATEYFDHGNAYLAQTGQLYVESGMMSFGRVYCFGPTFRAEKSKTRRHLTEFWMVEPEAAFVEHDGNLELQERFFSHIVKRVLEHCRAELELLGRDIEALERVVPPFPRITYDEALELVREHLPDDGSVGPIEWGEDLGAPHEVIISNQFDRPVFVERYPAAIRAFYMQPDPDRPEVVLCDDMLAPGLGELIGGSQRIHDVDLLEKGIRAHGLDVADYQWYLDLRRFGSVPHSGFGLGVERTVSWIAGVAHIRETIPFPRMLYKLYP